jgi:hypothetical protein
VRIDKVAQEAPPSLTCRDEHQLGEFDPSDAPTA